MSTVPTVRESARKLDSDFHADSIRKNHTANPAVKPLSAAWSRFNAAKAPLYALLSLTESQSGDHLENEEAMCRSISDNAQSIKDWIAWNSIAAEAITAGLENVVDAYRYPLIEAFPLPYLPRHRHSYRRNLQGTSVLRFAK